MNQTTPSLDANHFAFQMDLLKLNAGLAESGVGPAVESFPPAQAAVEKMAELNRRS